MTILRIVAAGVGAFTVLAMTFKGWSRPVEVVIYGVVLAVTTMAAAGNDLSSSWMLCVGGTAFLTFGFLLSRRKSSSTLNVDARVSDKGIQIGIRLFGALIAFGLAALAVVWSIQSSSVARALITAGTLIIILAAGLFSRWADRRRRLTGKDTDE